MLFAFLLAAAAAQAPATPPKIVSVVQPAKAIDLFSWFRADDYPAEAARKGVEGRVRFDAKVDADGKPTGCRIVQSSGSDLLDQATCHSVLARGRFKPARLRGEPVPSTFQTSITWRLAPATPPK